ncbi:hypothetical protein QBC46DRAFT_343278 [Diplogelasinospora grovesii]|uniref:HNH nuclease domain-containing protein n=1 Tax=Diplogelasinospora grovesii TaxID=303347 RepID=A0AAN6S3P1_9PEZI|nr:hypothetical protein QBC46DRAFT_343278 [Diplogelasinospora grovesii]
MPRPTPDKKKPTSTEPKLETQTPEPAYNPHTPTPTKTGPSTPRRSRTPLAQSPLHWVNMTRDCAYDLIGSEPAASDKSWNMISLSPQLHAWWDRQYFGLEYMGGFVLPNAMFRIQVRLQWLPIQPKIDRDDPYFSNLKPVGLQKTDHFLNTGSSAYRGPMAAELLDTGLGKTWVQPARCQHRPGQQRGAEAASCPCIKD